jgi:hypothetical protein
MPTLKGVSDLSKSMSGEYFNTEDIFEPWNEEEKWQEVDDISSFCPKYPASIQSTENQSMKSISEYLGLAPQAEVETKGKKAAKPVVIEFNDNKVNEEGHALPRVYVGKQSSAGKDVLTFRRQWTLQQVAVKDQMKAEQEAKALSNDDNTNNGDNVDKDTDATTTGATGTGTDTGGGASNGIGGVGESKTAGEVVLEELLPAVNITDPEGPEYDPLMCAAYRLVGQYAKLFSQPVGSTEAVPFLWKAIYPQLPSGAPCYNPAGKYCVKLFVGEWGCSHTI